MARPRTGESKRRGGRGALLGGAMSFHEIGQREGLTHSGAVMVYQRGIRKLREADPEILEMLLDLAADQDRARDRRVSIYEEPTYG